MSFFKRLFGNRDNENLPTKPEIEEYTGPNFPLCHSLEELLQHYAAIGYEKQLRFHEAIGVQPWNFDLKKGKITFGERNSYSAQILGTLSKSQETFLWSWANIHSGIPDQQLKQAKALKSYGDDHGILELFEESFNADVQFLHLIGMISTGMFESSCYYIADYGQGYMLMTISAAEVDRLDSDAAAVVIRVFPEMISKFTVSHFPALENYLKLKRYNSELSENEIKATKGNHILSATFDELGRMTKLTGGEKPE
jgi:hypothetical protein